MARKRQPRMSVALERVVAEKWREKQDKEQALQDARDRVIETAREWRGGMETAHPNSIWAATLKRRLEEAVDALLELESKE